MVVSKRFLSLPGESLVGAGEVVIELKQGVIGSFALELALLLSGLVQSLRIQPSKGPQLLVTLTDGERVSKANMTPEPPDTEIRLRTFRPHYCARIVTKWPKSITCISRGSATVRPSI